MCILFIAKNAHPNYPLLIAANRDEFLSRPTQAPHWWPDAPHLFAGKDLQAGGTWLGYNRQQRIAGITNLRCPNLYQSGANSRGDLVKGFLDIDSADTALAISQFTDCLQSSYKQYNPFNLLFGDARQLMIFSSSDGIARAVGDGVHSLSNGMPDDRWPKMQRGIEMLSNYLSEKHVISPDDIFSILTDKALPKPQLLPKTGVPFEAEYLLSSIYIPECSLNGMPYGTRSSSILWVKKGSPDDSVIMKSRSYQPTVG